MADFTPDPPFPKSKGDTVRSKDWNDLVIETQRLESEKVNNSGDNIAGPLTIDGNIGIKTTSPDHTLQVGDASTTVSMSLRGPSGNTESSVFAFEDDGSTNEEWFKFIYDSDTNRLKVTSPEQDSIITFERIDGRVGIGTTSPGELLEVYGLTAPRIAVHGGNNDANAGIYFMEDTDDPENPPPQYGYELMYDGAVNKFFINAYNRTSTPRPDLTIVRSSGNVGIGTVSPGFKLDVRGNIGNNTTLHHSDIRWKKNIETIPNALETVLNLRGVSFEWQADEYTEMNFSPGKHIGVIGQEVEQVISEVVTTDGEGYKTVEYANLIGILIEAIKELNNENEGLKQRIELLEVEKRLPS